VQERNEVVFSLHGKSKDVGEVYLMFRVRGGSEEMLAYLLEGAHFLRC
jgi:hypothetical protein